jgi:hypothetical protein
MGNDVRDAGVAGSNPATPAGPAAHVGQQPRRHRRRRLALFGGALADLLAVKHATLKVDKRMTSLRVR